MALQLSACGDIFDLTPWNNDSPGTGAAAAGTTSTIEATATYAVALGGVAPGRDELVIYNEDGTVRDFSGQTLAFETDNDNIELSPRPDFDDFAGGSGAIIIPKKVGVTIVSYAVDGVPSPDKYNVIVPPQSLIQALMGEARGQIANEAQTEDGRVALSSASPTGNAVGAVIRNRVLLLEADQPLSLFVVDEAVWVLDEPGSHWDAVITAENNGVYQFSPVDPSTMSYDIYMASTNRAGMLDDSEFIAYDQAVLTAAGIFANETADPTGGAFSFRTPPPSQAECLEAALTSLVTELPDGCGPGDENYPAFAPIQILIHPSVAKLSDGHPSFVFIRNRSPDEPVVTNVP